VRPGIFAAKEPDRPAVIMGSFGIKGTSTDGGEPGYGERLP
jgi:hypothetical protein